MNVNNLHRTLNTPYTSLDSWGAKLLHLGITLVLCSFLVFGLDAFDFAHWLSIPDEVAILGLHGLTLLTFVSLFVNQSLALLFYRNRIFRSLDLFYLFCANVLLISLLLTIVYGYSYNPFILEWLVTLKYTAMVVILPYAFSLFIVDLVYRSNHTTKSVDALHDDFLHFLDSNSVHRWSIQANRLLCISSADNYVTISYFDSEARVKKMLIRNTLKQVEAQFERSSLLRCHRSYIINTDNVESIKKVKRSYEIVMKGMDNPVPVSLSFIPKVEKLIS